MRHNVIAMLALLGASMLIMGVDCYKKPYPVPPADYSFEIPVKIFPVKRTYALTDTIWIETDIPAKFLYDTKSAQTINADTGKVFFAASYNEFGTYIVNPANGFCDVITQATGVNQDRNLGTWGTGGSKVDGCGQPDYRIRIGFKPNYRGAYGLYLLENLLLASCPSKIKPYNADVSFKYEAADLGFDIFNALSDKDKGGKSGVQILTDKINKKEVFVFLVN